MIVRKRSDVLKQINKLLDGRCVDCPQLRELNRIHGNSTSHVDGYCQRTCEVGRQLRGLGEQLNFTLNPRAELELEEVIQ